MFSADDAVALAAVRGREMAAACALESTGMAAVMGGDPDEIIAWLAEFDLIGANINGAGQIVAAGSKPALEKLAAAERPGTKLIVLKVAGAFHTRYMAPAQEALRERAAGIAVADPEFPLLSNADGTVVTSGAEMLTRLIDQVTRPVRWDRCMATLAGLGVTATVGTAAGRHPVRAGEAGTEGHGDAAAEDPGRPGQGRRTADRRRRVTVTGMTALTISTGPSTTRILGTGSHQPDKIVTNDDLAKIMDTNDEWIRDRVGIIERRAAGPDERVVDMGATAGAQGARRLRLSRRPTWTR